MKPAFIETSAINYCYDNNKRASELRQALEKRNFMPVVGIYTTYELARCAINFPDKLRELYSFLKDLEPDFSTPRENLYAMEIAKLTNNQPIKTLVNKTEILFKRIYARIDEYCCGIIPDEHKFFCLEREKQSEAYRQPWRPSDANKYSKFRNFDERLQNYHEYIEKKDPNILLIKPDICKLTKLELTEKSFWQLMLNLKLYPALRTFIYHQLYLDFLTEKNQLLEGPARDKYTDAIHVIEAAYCTAFISNDDKLLNKHLPKLNPDIARIEVQSLLPIGVRD